MCFPLEDWSYTTGLPFVFKTDAAARSAHGREYADGPVLPHRDRAALRGEGCGLRAVPGGGFYEGEVQAGDGAGGVEGMNYISLCSGIEAASEAFIPLD